MPTWLFAVVASLIFAIAATWAARRLLRSTGMSGGSEGS